jgi:hypothetical protein
VVDGVDDGVAELAVVAVVVLGALVALGVAAGLDEVVAADDPAELVAPEWPLDPPQPVSRIATPKAVRALIERVCGTT